MAEPNETTPSRVAIVGAGIAGLACAEVLADRGIEVSLFDKGKRPGGRLTSLQIDAGAWDLGAQYIEPGYGAFGEKVARWRRAGLVEDWPAGPPGALVGVPRMASLVEAECENRAVRFGAQVQRIDRKAGRWSLSGAWLAEGPFSAVVLALPAEQAAPLLALHDLEMGREAASVRSQPCWTVMAAFARRLDGAGDVLRGAGPIAWAARNGSKPERPGGECWVIQADPDWSRRHLEWAGEAVAAALAAEFAKAIGIGPLPEATFLKAHRWRFALPSPRKAGPLWNPVLRLGACGDWCAAPHVAGAWQAGHDLGLTVAQALDPVAAERAMSAAK